MPATTSADIKHSFCNVCAQHCGLDAYVENGKVVQVEASKPPFGSGKLCTKGQAVRAYVYREDRIQTPLRRIGKRGEGKFEPITWEEAYSEIAKKLSGYRKKFGPDSVAFFTGYSKWYRLCYHRFVYSFGTLNYGTDSSSCFRSTHMANVVNGGTLTRPDFAHTELFLSWGSNPFHNGNLASFNFDNLKEKGLKIILIDPRQTTFSPYADLQLRVRPGTDAAVAHYLARELIIREKTDKDYIERFVHGFAEYEKYVLQFDAARVSQITGISIEQLEKAADLITGVRRFSVAAGSTGNMHHTNGFQTIRAILSLSAITGNFDREGGNIPLEYTKEDYNKPTFPTDDFPDDFINEKRPKDTKPKIGSHRFPLWSEIVDEFQAMDLGRNILEGTPYPIKAVFALGMNVRMFPGDKHLFEALEKVPFYVDVDLFMTDSAKYADIVLPACSSFERTELVNSPQGLRLFRPIIEPLYQSKSDTDILCELAKRLKLDDPVLRGGYERIVKYLIRFLGVTYEDLCMNTIPCRIPGKIPYIPGSNLRTGLRTPTGKYELYSEIIAKHDTKYGYNPLPIYKEPLEDVEDPSKLPLTLVAGGRLPFAFHSRFHKVKWARSLRPKAAVDINPEDAGELKIRQDDLVVLESAHEKIEVYANLTHVAPRGSVFLFQGYSESDVNSIVGVNHLDPYSGFPGFRSVRCSVRRCD